MDKPWGRQANWVAAGEDKPPRRLLKSAAKVASSDLEPLRAFQRGRAGLKRTASGFDRR